MIISVLANLLNYFIILFVVAIVNVNSVHIFASPINNNMTTDFLKQAELVGANCRINNIKCAAQSVECIELIKKHGNALAIVNAFNKGWHNKHNELTPFSFN